MVTIQKPELLAPLNNWKTFGSQPNILENADEFYFDSKLQEFVEGMPRIVIDTTNQTVEETVDYVSQEIRGIWPVA